MTFTRNLASLRGALMAGAAAVPLLLAGAAHAQTAQDIQNQASEATPGGGIANGMPSIVGTRGGEPIIHYGPGATRAESSGLFDMRGGSEGGARVEPGPGAHGSFADGGIPTLIPGGHGEVVYTPATHPAPVSVAEATPAPMAPAAPAPMAATPGPRPLPGNVRAELASAEAALQHHQLQQADSRLEAAEVSLLNDRHDGEQGWHRPIQQMEAALDALRHHDAPRAEEMLRPLTANG